MGPNREWIWSLCLSSVVLSSLVILFFALRSETSRSNSSARRSLAISQIREQGGVIAVHNGSKVRAVHFRNTRSEIDLRPLVHFAHLESLDIRGGLCTDLEPLKHLRNLRTIRLDGSRISDLSSLSTHTGLQELSIRETDVRELACVANLSKLQYLDISFTSVGDLSPLFKLTSLNYLDVSGLSVSLEQLKRIRQANPNFKLDYTREQLLGWYTRQEIRDLKHLEIDIDGIARLEYEGLF